jgi:hypothetical protein
MIETSTEGTEAQPAAAGPLDLGTLNKSLPASEKPGLDTLDPRFQNIATLVEGSDFVGAAAQTEALFREDIYDVRVVGYYLYGFFLQNGLGALGDIFDCLVKLAGENWAAIGPTKKKEQHAQNALFWFYTRLAKKLEAEIEAKGEEFEKWKGAVSSEQAQALIEKHQEFKKALSAIIPEPKAGDLMKKVDDHLKAYAKLVYVEPIPEPAPTEAAPAEAAPAETAAGAPAARPAAGAGAVPGAPAMEGSFHLQLLMNKLKAFEVVIEKQDWNRAAVISDDIAAIVGAFDPRVYFPKLFATYYALLSKNIEQIAPLWDTKETPLWKALEQFYRVDLEGFASS